MATTVSTPTHVSFEFVCLIWILNGGVGRVDGNESGEKKLTVDQEFEQYFSNLML